jgi:hypothetical protein
MIAGELETAVRHLMRSTILLERQRVLVAATRGQGEAAWMARQILARLEELNLSFKGHVRILEQEVLEEARLPFRTA